MALQLDHTIVPARNREAAARFISRILQARYLGLWRDFAIVQVNEVFTLDFCDENEFGSHHYAFLATDQEFDDIIQRLRSENHPFGTGRPPDNGEISHSHGGRGVYFKCKDGHMWEILTHSYILD